MKRLRPIIRLAFSMMLHDRAKLIGTVTGVVFAVVLAAQQLGVLFGLLDKNTMFVDHAGADVWICPPGTRQLAAGSRMSETLVWRARATPGVVDASALLYSGAAVQRPWGGSEAVTLIGFDLSTRLGAPWNVVAGDVGSLALPGMVVLEDSQREKLGAVNLGSVREMNGQRVRVAGFTWGLAPFAPPYAFTTLERARQIAKVGALEQDFVLVRGQNGVDPDVLAEVLQARLPETKVYSARALHQSIVRSLLAEQLGISFGTSTAFGLLIGFIIVALSMFSAVLDNLREFGTLKAIGVTNGELAILLLVQSAAYALLGSLVGLGLVAGMAEGIRSANLSVIVPWQLVAATPVVMMTLCALASALALSRIRKLEPGMVFR